MLYHFESVTVSLVIVGQQFCSWGRPQVREMGGQPYPRQEILPGGIKLWDRPWCIWLGRAAREPYNWWQWGTLWWSCAQSGHIHTHLIVDHPVVARKGWDWEYCIGWQVGSPLVGVHIYVVSRLLHCSQSEL